MSILAVHGHFYQPDRRDPTSLLVPLDWTAAPAANWNQRITIECYDPNALAGNLARMSFNFGPTLLTWLREVNPGLHAAVSLAGARGHNALAQGWHHAILPLALPRDRRTEIAWGVADFAYRFGYAPVGFWLPECAVDTPTLLDLADAGIRYVILAPWQLTGALDTRRPYRVELPGDRRIIVMPYDGGLSGEVSFSNEATANADHFVRDWVLPHTAPLEDGGEPILLVATDGELYGHHKPYRDWFLRELPLAAGRAGMRYATLNELLTDLDPATLPEAWLRENTSWSCHHGVARWSEDCPCCSDGRWKPILRHALLALAEELDAVCEAAFAHLGIDLWSVREQYAIVAAGYEDPEDFARAATAGTEHARDPYTAIIVRDLLAAQRSRLAMFTSCAWFWEDPSRQETVNVLRYAADAIARVRLYTELDAEPAFIAALAPIHSHITGESGADLYARALRESSRIIRTRVDASV
jgi:hypothetical protein